MPTTRFTCRWLLRALCALALLLAVAEGCARFAWAAVEPLKLVALPPLSAPVEFDPHAGWRAAGSGSIAPKKRASVRVVIFGDALGLGAGAYPERLAAMLRDRFPNSPVEVLNLSAPGYSIARIEARLAGESARLGADFVVVQSFAQDVAAQGVRDSRLIHATAHERLLWRWAGSSRLADGLLQKVAAARAGDSLAACGLPRVGLEDYLFTATRLRDLARRQGMELVVVSPLWQRPAEPLSAELLVLAEYASKVRDLGNWHEMEFVDPEGYDAPQSPLYSGRFTLSAQGHEQVAARILQNLRLRVWNRINELAEAWPGEVRALDYR